LNQIEVIRALAISLPIDMVLIVKEHPWMVGKRSFDAYQKMLNIPRVRLVNPALDARAIINGASLVAVVTGSIALEAAIIGKPVITFGECPYNALPETMVRRCKDLRALPELLRTTLLEYRNVEAALEAYVAATYANSESVNLYSVLLEKKGVHQERSGDFFAEAGRLAQYALRTWRNSAADHIVEAGAAAW
jgi:capsule polysaccharide export protein KpsC/LpsZ